MIPEGVAQDTCVPFPIPCLPPTQRLTCLQVPLGAKGRCPQDKAADYCTGGDEKSPTPRSDPDKGLELMVCKKSGFRWVI